LLVWRCVVIGDHLFLLPSVSFVRCYIFVYLLFFFCVVDFIFTLISCGVVILMAEWLVFMFAVCISVYSVWRWWCGMSRYYVGGLCFEFYFCEFTKLKMGLCVSVYVSFICKFCLLRLYVEAFEYIH
jgi:hypothetical protein